MAKLRTCTDRFDDGAKGFAKGCLGKLDARQRADKPKTLRLLTGDLATLEGAVDALVAGIVSAILNTL